MSKYSKINTDDVDFKVYLSNYNDDENQRRFYPSNIAKLVKVVSSPKYFYEGDRSLFVNGTYLVSNPDSYVSGSTPKKFNGCAEVVVRGYIIDVLFNNFDLTSLTDCVGLALCAKVGTRDIEELQLARIYNNYTSGTDDFTDGDGYVWEIVTLWSGSEKLYTPITDLDSIDGQVGGA